MKEKWRNYLYSTMDARELFGDGPRTIITDLCEYIEELERLTEIGRAAEKVLSLCDARITGVFDYGHNFEYVINNVYDLLEWHNKQK